MWARGCECGAHRALRGCIVTRPRRCSAHIALVSLPFVGHVEPLVALAQSLSARDIRTTFAVPPVRGRNAVGSARATR